jgi:hypothetical protein
MFNSIEFAGYGEQLGDGFDSSTGEIRASAIKGMSEYLRGDSKKNLLQEIMGKPLVDTYSLEFMKSKVDLYEYFVKSNDLMGQGTGNIKGVTLYANGGRKSNFFAQTKFQQECTYILFEYQLKYVAYRLDNPELSESAKVLLRNSGSEKFRRKYGDEFIIGFSHGAEYSALIEISKQDEESMDVSQKSLKGQIAFSLGLPFTTPIDDSGNLSNTTLGGVTSGGGNSNEGKLKANRSLYKSNVRCYKRGANTRPQIVLSLGELIEDFKGFKDNVLKTGGVEYTTLLADYDYLEDIEESLIPESIQRLQRQLKSLNQRKQFLEKKLFQLECKLKFSGSQSSDTVTESRKTIDDLDSFIDRYLNAPSLLEPSEVQNMMDKCQKQSRKLLSELDKGSS